MKFVVDGINVNANILALVRSWNTEALENNVNIKGPESSIPEEIQNSKSAVQFKNLYDDSTNILSKFDYKKR